VVRDLLLPVDSRQQGFGQVLTEMLMPAADEFTRAQAIIDGFYAARARGEDRTLINGSVQSILQGGQNRAPGGFLERPISGDRAFSRSFFGASYSRAS
jgi:hypothetical protein